MLNRSPRSCTDMPEQLFWNLARKLVLHPDMGNPDQGVA